MSTEQEVLTEVENYLEALEVYEAQVSVKKLRSDWFEVAVYAPETDINEIDEPDMEAAVACALRNDNLTLVFQLTAEKDVSEALAEAWEDDDMEEEDDEGLEEIDADEDIYDDDDEDEEDYSDTLHDLENDPDYTRGPFSQYAYDHYNEDNDDDDDY